MSEKLSQEDLSNELFSMRCHALHYWHTPLAKQECGKAKISEAINRIELAHNQFKEMICLIYGFTPTPEHINALPEPIRKYIHDLETNCDPAGIVRENVLLKDENEALRLKLKQRPRVTPDHVIAKLIDTLGWKFSHLPHAKEKFISIQISRDEYQELKDFVEVSDE